MGAWASKILSNPSCFLGCLPQPCPTLQVFWVVYHNPVQPFKFSGLSTTTLSNPSSFLGCLPQPCPTHHAFWVVYHNPVQPFKFSGFSSTSLPDMRIHAPTYETGTYTRRLVLLRGRCCCDVTMFHTSTSLSPTTRTTDVLWSILTLLGSTLRNL